MVVNCLATQIKMIIVATLHNWSTPQFHPPSPFEGMATSYSAFMTRVRTHVIRDRSDAI
jgi:hypothetical protein